MQTTCAASVSARLADRILVLAEGEIFRIGAPDEVFADVEGLRGVGLDAPAAQRFAAELRAAGFDLPQRLYDVDSLAAAIAAQLGGGADGQARPSGDGQARCDGGDVPRGDEGRADA